MVRWRPWLEAIAATEAVYLALIWLLGRRRADRR